MFCKNCGAQVPDGTKFCPECGTELTSQTTNDVGQINGTIQTGTTQNTPKRKFSLKWALLIVAVLCVGTAAFAAPKIVRKIKMAAMSPEEYYRYVEKNNLNEHLDALLSGYDMSLEQMKKDTYGAHQTMKLDLSDTAKSLLSATGVDFTNLKTIEIDLDSSMNKDKIGYKAALMSEDEQLIAANVIMDGKAGDMYIQIPEFSESYIRIPSDQLSESSDSSDVSKSIKTMTDLGDKMPSRKEINEITDLCIDTALNDLTNIKEEKDANVSAEGIDEKATNYVITLNQKDAQKCVKDVAGKLKDNKTLKDVITRFDEEAYTSFTEAIDDLTSDSDSDTSENAAALRMTVSINDSDTIIGRNIEALDDDGKVTVGLSYCIPSNKNKFGFNFTIHNNSEKIAEVKGTGNIKSDVLNADLSVVSDKAVEALGNSDKGNELAKIKIEDYDYSKSDKAKSSGKFTVSASNIIPQINGYSLIYEFDVDGLSSNQKIHVMAGKDKFASLTLDSKSSTDYKAEIPGDSDKVIDSTDSDGMASYADMTKVQSVLSNMFTKLGLDSSVIDSLFGMSMGGSSDSFDDSNS